VHRRGGKPAHPLRILTYGSNCCRPPAFILLLGPILGSGHQIAAGHPDRTLNSGRVSLIMVGFLPAMFFYFQAVKLFWRLLGEIQAGTIEQVYLSPLPSWLVAAAYLAAGILIFRVLSRLTRIRGTLGAY
jgi:ABC-2 type transport system permease protein